MSPLYMIKSRVAREVGKGGRETSKPTGVRHASLLMQTAGTSCSKIKHLIFYCAEHPSKKHMNFSLPLQKDWPKDLRGVHKSLYRALVLK